MSVSRQTLRPRDLFAESARQCFGLVAWTGAVGLALSLEVMAIFAHYLSTSGALELLGEQRPLASEPLLGWLLEGMFGEANQNHFRAGIIVCVIAIGSLTVAQLLVGVMKHVGHRAAYGQSIAALDPTDPDFAELTQARTALNHRIALQLVWLILFAVLVGYAAYWDLSLNWYQQIASLRGIEQPAEALRLIRVPGQELQAYGDSFAWHLAEMGAWGFLAVMIMGAVFLEYSVQRVSERWGTLVNTVADLFAFGLTTSLPPANPADGGESVPAAAGQPVHQAAEASTGPLFDGPEVEEPASAAAPRPAAQTADPEVETVEVIGGAAGERVSLETALRDSQRYWVDRDTGLVWNRAYHEALSGAGG